MGHHFQHGIADIERGVERGQLPGFEVNINDRADNLDKTAIRRERPFGLH
jgi:hypothetical protein